MSVLKKKKKSTEPFQHKFVSLANCQHILKQLTLRSLLLCLESPVLPPLPSQNITVKAQLAKVCYSSYK